MAKQKKPRNIVVLGMLGHCKGGRMRDRRLRREKERANEWRDEMWDKHLSSQ